MNNSVFFNPACDNCKTVKGILEVRNIGADYVHYLDQAPSREQIEQVMGLLGIDDPQEMMRAKEPVYQELNLESADRDTLINAMTEHPILIQRPIVIVDNKAVIARPAEKVLEILAPTSG